MSNHFINLIFLSSLIILSNSIYKGDKLSLIEQFEVEDLARSLFDKHTPLIMNLFNLGSTSGGIKCDVCSFAVDVLKNYLLQKHGIEKFYALVKDICHYTKLDNKVCDGAIDHYGDIVVESFLKRFLNGDYICTLFKLCSDTTEYDTIDDYARRILKDKPETKDREVIPKKADEEYYKVVQVSDIHLDMEYKEGAVANCNLPLCCRELQDDDLVPVKQTYAGLYGTIGKCDANIETVRAFAEKASELNPDYIMFTGDNIAHSVWLVTQEEVIRATKMQIEAIQEKFGNNTPIYPAIGNHERAPVDEFHGEESELLEGLAAIFKPYLDEQAYESFRKYGYYTMLIKNNLRIVSINCLLCDSMNFYLLYDYTQVRAMINWLEQVLSDAEKNGEVVHIMNHIPMLSTQHTIQCAWRIKILLDRYQNIIRGYFSGHSHSEYFSMIHEYYNETIPTHINYVCSGLTPYSEYQPSFRLYLIDKQKLYVQDYVQYRMNLIESNEQRTPIWFISYNATDLFGVTSLNDVKSVAKFKISPEYIQHKYTDVPGSEDRGKDEGTRTNEQCNFDNDNMEGVFNCKGYSILSSGYLYYMFNKLSFQWTK